MKNVFKTSLVLFLIAYSALVLSAIEVYEFSDPSLKQRFHDLTYELRCPKCQNQNLADSNSELSLDLKDIIYEKLKSGETDEQIIQFMRERYGEFILFKPEMSASNSFLWFGPVLFLLGFLVLFIHWYRKNREINDD